MAEGLLGRIGGGIKGLLGDAGVQGAVGAALMGANPLIGLLAGPIIKSDRERSQLRNDELRQQIADRKTQREARDKLSTLMDDQTLVQGAPGTPFVGLDGEMFGQVPGLLGQVPTLSTAGGKQEALSLLQQSNPDVFAQSLLGQLLPTQTRSDPSLVRSLRAAGIDPMSKQGRDIIVNNLSGGSTQEQIDLLKTQLTLLDLQSKANELETGKKEETTFQENLFSSTQTLLDLASANATLKGTAQQTGQGAGVRRGVTQGVGVLADIIGFDEFAGDTLNQANILEAFDTNASQVVLDAQALEDAGVSSNLGLSTRLQSKPSSGKGFVANSVAIANNLQGRINLFDAMGITDEQLVAQGLPTRKDLQAIIDEARRLSVGNEEDISDDDIRTTLGLD